MKKLIVLTLTSVLFTAGCASMAEMQSASQKGVANAYSCDQINSAFNAYEADRNSFAALKQIAIMSGVTIEQTPQIDVASYYEMVKNAANVALIVQGCQPRQ